MNLMLYELAYRKEIQDKLRKEVIEVEKRYNGEITYEAISEMTYLDQIVNGKIVSSSVHYIIPEIIVLLTETLRMYSPIGQLFRTAINDYKVPGTDFVIESGMSVIIPVSAIHRDSRYYYDPNVFNPDRFSAEEVNKRHHYSYLPFGKKESNFLSVEQILRTVFFYNSRRRTTQLYRNEV